MRLAVLGQPLVGFPFAETHQSDQQDRRDHQGRDHHFHRVAGELVEDEVDRAGHQVPGTSQKG